MARSENKDSFTSSINPDNNQQCPLDCAIVLIGFMGSGKSCVARMLARDLNIEAVDLDKIVEQKAGCSIAELFTTQGESAFRALETQVLAETLEGCLIISTGGGIITRTENRNLLREAQQAGTAAIIYLKAAPQTLAERIRRQPGKRPLIDGDAPLDIQQTRRRVEELMTARSHLYEECADLILETDAMEPGQVAQTILHYIESTGD